MRDRELFQRAVRALPVLALPLLASRVAGSLVKDSIPKMVGMILSLKAGDPLGQGGVLFLVLLLSLTGMLAAVLLSLGASLLCLERGEGRRGIMPWAIFGQWRRYWGWALWMGVFPVLWRAGKKAGWLWLGSQLDDMAFARFNQAINYYNVALNVATLLLFSLLALSVQTAYLRSPEGGFWRAVRFGLGEGLRKWPKTIGVQLKFVVPVHLGLGISAILLRRLVLQAGIPGLSLLCDGVGQGLNLSGSIWILTLYGQLAASRYDYPEKKEEVETL